MTHYVRKSIWHPLYLIMGRGGESFMSTLHFFYLENKRDFQLHNLHDFWHHSSPRMYIVRIFAALPTVFPLIASFMKVTPLSIFYKIKNWNLLHNLWQCLMVYHSWNYNILYYFYADACVAEITAGL